MHKPTKDLGDEHGAILAFLNVSRIIAQQLEAGASVDKKDLEDTVDFIRTFADKCHHAKEEQYTFPLLLQKSQKNAVLVNQLLGEHKSARDYVRGIADAVPAYVPGSTEAWHISRNLEGYADLLHKHIRTEAEHLFPLMETEFTPEEIDRLWDSFEKIEHDVIGSGKHEAYHEWLHRMTQKYLPN